MNWYIVLELEFFPNPVDDWETIEKRINEKRGIWSQKSQIDVMNGPTYTAYLENLDEMRNDMQNKATRDRLVKEACENVFGDVDNYLDKKKADKGSIDDNDIKNILSVVNEGKKKTDYSVTEKDVQERAKLKHIAYVEVVDYDAVYKKHVGDEPKIRDNLTTSLMESELRLFKPAKNLYDFLYPNTAERDKHSGNRNALLERTKKKREEFAGNVTPEKGPGEKLCGLCEQAFESDASKKLYDDYLAYHAKIAVLNKVGNDAKIHSLSETDCNEFISELMKIFNDQKIAKELFIAYCENEKIEYKLGDGKKKGGPPPPTPPQPPGPTPPGPPPPKPKLTESKFFKPLLILAGLIIVFVIVGVITMNNYDPDAFRHMDVTRPSRPIITGLSGTELIDIEVSVTQGGLGWGRQEISYFIRPFGSEQRINPGNESVTFIFTGSRTITLNPHYFASASNYILSIMVNGVLLREINLHGR